MLPITRKSLHVPHGLAMLAAAFGLVASLTWSAPEDAERQLAHSEVREVDIDSVSSTEAATPAESARAEAEDCRQRRKCGRSATGSLLPALLPDPRFF